MFVIVQNPAYLARVATKMMRATTENHYNQLCVRYSSGSNKLSDATTALLPPNRLEDSADKSIWPLTLIPDLPD